MKTQISANTVHMLVTASIGLALVAASPALMPQPRELAIMLFRDKEFEKAQEMLLLEYQRGSRQIAIMSPLARLNLQQGNVEGAIRIMEEMEALRPNDPTVQRELGQYYQFAQRPADYLRTLEKRRAIAPSADVLRALSQIYNFLGRYDDQVVILEEMIRQRWSSPEDLQGAAYLMAARGQVGQALKAMEQQPLARGKKDEFTDQPTEALELRLHLLIDSGNNEELAKYITRWLAAVPRDQTLYTVLGILEARSRPDMAVRIIEAEEKIRALPIPVRERQAASLVDLGRHADSYQLFKQHLPMETLSPVGRQTFVEAASRLRRFPEVIAALRSGKGSSSEASVAIALEEALEVKAVESIPALVGFISAEGRALRPVLMARIAFALGDSRGAAQWLDAAERASLPPGQELDLVELMHRLDRPGGASRLERLAGSAQISASLFPRIAGLFVKMGKPALGETALALQSKNGRGNASVIPALLIVQSAQGRKPTAQHWLDSEDGRSTAVDTLRNAYDVASDVAQWPLAADFADSLHRRQNTLDSLARVIEATAASGDRDRLTRVIRAQSGQTLAEPTAAARIANALTDSERGDLALVVLDPMEPRFAAAPDLLVGWARAQLQIGNPKLAFNRLKTEVDHPAAPTTLKQMTVEAAIASGQWRYILSRDAAWLRSLPDYLQAGMVQAAMADGSRAETDQLVDSLGQGVLTRNPLLWAEFDLRRGERMAALAHMADEAARPDRSPAERVHLGLLWLSVGEKDKASGLLAKLAANPLLSNDLLPGMARLYLGLGRGAEGLALVEARMKRAKDWPTTTAWAMLAVAARQGERVTVWLRDAPLGPEDRPFLRDLYYAAAGGNAPREALVIAERLWSLGQLPEDRLILARAKLEGGKLAEALTLTEELGEATPDTLGLRMATLTAGVRAGLIDKGPLVHRLAEQLASAQGPQRRQLIFDLQSLKAYDAILPYVSASTDPEMVAIYMDLLAATGRKDELDRILQKRALDPATPEDERRTLAFNLLSQGRKAPAEQVLRALAARHGPASKDLADLRYLWGPRADASGLDWLAARANESKGETQADWLRVMVEVGGTPQASAVLNALVTTGGMTPPLRIAAVRIHNQMNDTGALREALEEASHSEIDVNTLRDFVIIARDRKLPELARKMGLSLLARKESDAETLKILGHMAYLREDYEETRRFLTSYLSVHPKGDFESHFYMGEVRGRAKDPIGSAAHYTTAIEQIEQLTNPSFFPKHLRGLIFQRLKRYDDAIAVFEKLLKEAPNHDGLRADIAETYLLKRTPDRARDVLMTGRRR